MGVLVAPSMFHDANVPGTVCVKQTPSPESKLGETVTTWYQEQASEIGCLPMETTNPKVDSLRESLLAFRFPTDETKPSSYSRWNWRLLGSLYLSLSFNEDELVDLDDDKNITAYAVNQRNVPV